MRRRSVLAAIGGAAAFAPLSVRAQKPPPPMVGFLSLLPQETLDNQVKAFLEGLARQGFASGSTVAIEYRWADNDAGRLPALAAELVRLQPAVIVAAGGNISAAAAQAATSTIPIVFTAARDAVQTGLVVSMGRPGGNATGIVILAEALDAKRLELLHELAPSQAPAGALINPSNPSAAIQRSTLQESARALGRPLHIVEASSESDIDSAFARLASLGATGLVAASDPFFTSQRVRIVGLAAQYRLPAVYQWRQFVEVGGLASYGPSFDDAYREAGVLTGRILRGERPANLPVQQPTKFELVINQRVARNLGLVIPSILLTRADEIVD